MRRHRNLTFDEDPELEALAAAIPKVNNITLNVNDSSQLEVKRA